MAAQEYTHIDDILKEYYSPVLVNQAYKKAPFWAQIQKVPVKNFYGRRVVLPIQVAFTEAVGTNLADDYAIPSAGRNLYDLSHLYMKRMYGRVQVDGFSIAATKGAGSWIDILTQEMKGVMNAFALSMDRQTMGTGRGVLALVSSRNGNIITVKSPHEVASDTPAAKYFRKGMILDFFSDDAGADVGHDNEVTLISGADVTVGGTVTADADDYIVRKDSATFGGGSGALDESADFMGVDGIVSDANYPITGGGALSDFQYINREGATPELTWRSYVDSSSQVISETVIQEALDEIEKVSVGDAPNFGMTTYALRNKLINIIRSDRLVEQMELKAGWKAIRYIGGSVELPIMVHKNCPTGYFYFISLSHLKWYSLKKLVWDNKGGGIIKPVTDQDKYEAWWKMYANMGTDCSNAHGKLTGLTVS